MTILPCASTVGAISHTTSMVAITANVRSRTRDRRACQTRRQFRRLSASRHPRHCIRQVGLVGLTEPCSMCIIGCCHQPMYRTLL
ncbi:hypothetical protein WOLCODRAFT_26508, partial [Wolfiporia cocos MD-104 SS10]